MVHPKIKVLNNVTSSVNNNNGFGGRRRTPPDTNYKFYLRVLLLTVFFILSLLINGDVQPLVRRGFFCNDSSILYPYKTDTVGIKTLMLLALILPGILISYCNKKLKLNLKRVNPPSLYDSSRYKLNRRRVSGPQGEITVEEEELMTHVKRRNFTIHEGQDEEGSREETEPMNVGFDIPEEISGFEQENKDIGDIGVASSGSDDSSDAEINLFTRIPLNDLTVERKRNYLKAEAGIHQTRKTTNLITRGFGEFQLFFFGLSCTLFITGLGKITCGRLRPHFMDRCRPNVDCLLPENAHRYIEDFTCNNLTSKEYPYITTSWPSGHASVIFYSMTYLILYLNYVIPIFFKLSPPRIKWRYNPIFLYSLYLFMVSIAFWVAVTRVSDYHHHAIDVFSGTVMGIAIALTLSKVYSKPFFQQ